MAEIASRLAGIRSRIAAAGSGSGMQSKVATLVAVSKTCPAGVVREAVEAGQIHFGESRFQEAESKIEVLPRDLEWHFIGSIQRNKVRKILPLFSYIHAVDSLKLAAYLDGIAAELALKPKIFLQVNQAGEASKGGFGEDELRRDFVSLCALEHVSIVGLMTIPPASDDLLDAKQWFRRLRLLRDSLEGEFSVALPFLSMGMSGDFEVAVEEGATHVRVGSAIFGSREHRIEGELG